MKSDGRTPFNEPSSTQTSRRKRAKSKQVFKRFEQRQAMLLLPGLEELTPEQHLVRGRQQNHRWPYHGSVSGYV